MTRLRELVPLFAVPPSNRRRESLQLGPEEDLALLGPRWRAGFGRGSVRVARGEYPQTSTDPVARLGIALALPVLQRDRSVSDQVGT